ncbi:MAG: tetratricopeptide repeat protein [Pirellulales bacterium]|nr:tetratricopeptide repeat protein [Pirellulales bacterium]
MSTSANTATATPRAWIVSPAWDLTYLLLTPLAIVPAVLIAARQWLAPEQVDLAVIAFASLGHHLPGFMRAYGDRALFARFRWRFLLAPPLVFALALAFTPPRRLADAFSVPWSHLHGLELILLAWGTWHGLMQTYGFMRIYDLRRGMHDRRTARLDHALCLAMFVAGVVFSDTRMFGVAAAMWQSGLPLFGPDSLKALRVICGVLGAAVLLAYGLNLLDLWRRGIPLNGLKLLLAAATSWFYWYCGRLSTNVLIGIAMFEIYHAVQYNAIVWVYNRRLCERAGAGFGPLAFLFRDRRSMLGAYLAAIAAYSSIRFFTAQPGDRLFSGDLDNARQWLVAAFAASSLLHFYYDGFIWKVSEPTTRDNLLDRTGGAAALEHYVPALVHAGKWMLLLAIAALLIGAERAYYAHSSAASSRQEQVLAALAELTPRVPQAQEISRQLRTADADRAYQRGLSLLQRGDARSAIDPLQLAVRLDPAHFQAFLQLGDALMALAKPAAAAGAYSRAVALRPDLPEAQVDLAAAQLQLGRLDAAESTLRTGLARQANSPELNFTLGVLLEQSGRAVEAAGYLRRAAELGLSR